jgi:DNA-binding transcriptional LysR family regulator
MALTADGRAMVGFAKGIVEAQEKARRYFSRSHIDLEGRVRLGAGENFGLFILPKILPVLRQQHPLLDVEVRIGTQAVLHKGLAGGDLDLIVAKYRHGEGIGQRVRREKLVWVGRDPSLVTTAAPIPLVLLDPPSMTRSVAIETLENAGRAWRISCTSENANGLRAAVLAGLGVAVQSESMLEPELAGLVLDRGLPDLGFVDYTMVWPPGGGSRMAKLLAQAIFAAGRR